jgi:hypothetical protein
LAYRQVWRGCDNAVTAAIGRLRVLYGSENVALQRRLDEHDRLIAVHQEDLAASRQGDADDIARLTADTTSPVVVIRHQP